MANEDRKTPRPDPDSEEMVGSEGVEDPEFDSEAFDDEDQDDEESGDEEESEPE
jgi:hypothetical protein